MAAPIVDDGLVYKFAELSIVTSESLEECVNTWVAQGWRLDGIRFVVTEASRRPAMAFVSFVRPVADGAAAVPPPAEPPILASASPAPSVPAARASGRGSRSRSTPRRSR